MLPKIVIVILILFVTVFVFKDKLPINQSSTNKPDIKTQESKNMTFDDVLSLGGTCFNLPFIDETKDVEAAVDGESRTKALDKDEYDINRISIGKDGDSFISMWEFVGEIGATWNDDHNIMIQTYHDTDKQEDDRFDVIKEAYSKEWRGRLVSGDGKISDFDPLVKLNSKTIQFTIPYSLISQNGIVDGLAFVANFYNKPIKTTYSDTVWPPVNKRVKGHFTSFYCDRKS